MSSSSSSLPLVASITLPVADQLITPDQFVPLAAPVPLVPASSIAPPPSLLLPSPFTELATDTNLNEAPTNWLTDGGGGGSGMMRSPGSAAALVPSSGASSLAPRPPSPASHVLASHAPLSTTGELASSELAAFDAHADVLAPTANIKKLFKMSYSAAPVSMAVHRIGSTLVLDGSIDPFQVPGDAPIPPKKARATTDERVLYSKFLYHQMESGARAGPHADSRLGSTAAPQGTPFLVDPAVPLPSSSKHTQTFAFKLRDQNLLLGSELLVFSTAGHPAVSLKLHSVEEEITRAKSLDLWLDNVLADVPELCICYHKEGYVQGYQIVPTDEIPYLPSETAAARSGPRGSRPSPSSSKPRKASRSPAFSASVVEDTAASVLQFLQDNATRDGGTYWLYKGSNDSTLSLYDLNGPHADTDTDSGRAPPFAFAVAMLCYRLGFKLMESSHESHDVDRIKHARSLLERARDLLDPRTRPGVYVAVTRKLAESHIAEHRAGLPTARILAKTDVNANPTVGVESGSDPASASSTPIVQDPMYSDAIEVESYVRAGALTTNALSVLVTMPLVTTKEGTAHFRNQLVDVKQLWIEVLCLVGELHVYLALSSIKHVSPMSALRHVTHALVATCLIDAFAAVDLEGRPLPPVQAIVRALASQALGDIIAVAAQGSGEQARSLANGVDSVLADMLDEQAGPKHLLDNLDVDEAKELEYTGLAARLGLIAHHPDVVRKAHAKVLAMLDPAIGALRGPATSLSPIVVYNLMLSYCTLGRAALRLHDSGVDDAWAEIKLREAAINNLLGSSALESADYALALEHFARAQDAFTELPETDRTALNLAGVIANVARVYRMQAHDLAGEPAISPHEEDLYSNAISAYVLASKTLASRKLSRTVLWEKVNSGLGGAYLAFASRLLPVAPSFASSADDALRIIHKRLDCALKAYTMAGATTRVALVRVEIFRLYAVAIGTWSGLTSLAPKGKLAFKLFTQASDAVRDAKLVSEAVKLAAIVLDLDRESPHLPEWPFPSPYSMLVSTSDALADTALDSIDDHALNAFVESARAWLRVTVTNASQDGSTTASKVKKLKAAYKAALLLSPCDAASWRSLSDAINRLRVQ